MTSFSAPHIRTHPTGESMECENVNNRKLSLSAAKPSDFFSCESAKNTEGFADQLCNSIYIFNV